jgi:hypothetical protein
MLIIQQIISCFRLLPFSLYQENLQLRAPYTYPPQDSLKLRSDNVTQLRAR